MSLDKTFRFDESVCGRCGRTAPAGCICVGTKAFESGQRVFYRQPVYSDNPEDQNPEGESGQVGHTTPEEYPENVYTVINQHPTEKNRYYIRDSSGTEFAFPEEMLTPYNDPPSNEDQKCFKALSDLIGYNVKATLTRYHEHEDLSQVPGGEQYSGPAISSYSDTHGRRSLEEQEEYRQENERAGWGTVGLDNPNAPYSVISLSSPYSEAVFADAADVYSEQHTTRADTPQRLAEIAAEDDDEPEEFKYEKMLSYLNTGSGGALVPPPEFSLKAKKKKKTVQGEGKSQQSLEYGDPVILANRGVDADTQKETAQPSYVYGQASPETDSHIVYVSGSRFPYSSGNNVVLYDTSRRNRTKSITPPRVKMGVMRATAPNRIDLVVEIVAKIFNEQAVQQFLQEMAGGVPPQQGKMFRKAYRRPQDNSPFSPETQRIITETLRPGEGARTEEQPYGTTHELDSRLKRELEERIAQRKQELKFLSILTSFKRFRVPFVKNLRGHLVKAGFTGTMQDAMGRRMCFSAGKRVHCARDERGTHDDKVRQEEAPVPGNLSSGEGTANPAMQGIDVLKEIKFRIQGIAAQCSLPPNAVRDVVLFLLEVPDEFLMAFNSELDMRGEEIRAILFEAVSALAPQPVDQVETGRPVPPTLGKKSVDSHREANPPGFTELINLRGAHPRGSQEWHKYDEALRNRYLGTGAASARAHTNEYMSDIYHQQEPYDPVVRDDPPPEGQKSSGLSMLKKAWEDLSEEERQEYEDHLAIAQQQGANPEFQDVIGTMHMLRTGNNPYPAGHPSSDKPNTAEGQKSLPSPDLVLYEMQRNPNPTELERMQMELLMRILNDRFSDYKHLENVSVGDNITGVASHPTANRREFTAKNTEAPSSTPQLFVEEVSEDSARARDVDTGTMYTYPIHGGVTRYVPPQPG